MAENVQTVGSNGEGLCVEQFFLKLLETKSVPRGLLHQSVRILSGPTQISKDAVYL